MAIVVSKHPMDKYKDRFASGVIKDIVTDGIIDYRDTDPYITVMCASGFVATIDKWRILTVDGKSVNYPKPKANVAIKVQGTGNAIYDVRRYNGIETCSCKGFQFRGACKHLSQLAA